MQSANLKIIFELNQLSSETPELSRIVVPATTIYTAVRVSCDELFGHNHTVEFLGGGIGNVPR